MQVVDIKDNKNNIIKKHQELVRNARYGLGDLAIKTLSILISMIKVSDTDFQEYGIKLSDLKELTGVKSKNVDTYVDKMTTELLSSPLMIDEHNKLNWVTLAHYEKGSNLVIFEIHRYLKPYLLELKNNFLTYDISNILVLKSGYVIRLYELCKDHYNEVTRYKLKASVVFDIKIDRLREQFEIPKSYQYKDIRVHIIDKAVKQFKEKTDIQISYKEIKLGRRVDSIQITVKSNTKGSNDYTKHKQAFISYMRKEFVNADILKSRDKGTNREMMISIAPDGKLYDKKGIEFEASRANDIWSALYEMSQKGQLACLNTNKEVEL